MYFLLLPRAVLNTMNPAQKLSVDIFRSFIDKRDSGSAVVVLDKISIAMARYWPDLSDEKKEDVRQQLSAIALDKGQRYLNEYDEERGTAFETYFIACMRYEILTLRRKSKGIMEDPYEDDLEIACKRTSAHESGADMPIVKKETNTKIVQFQKRLNVWIEGLRPVHRKALQIRLGINLTDEELCKIEEIRNRPGQRGDGVYSTYLQEECGLSPENARQKMHEAKIMLEEFLRQTFNTSDHGVMLGALTVSEFQTKEESEPTLPELFRQLSGFSDEECAEIFVKMASTIGAASQYPEPELSSESIYTLTEDQKILFSEIEGTRLPFEGFYNFAELRCNRNVDLCIVDTQYFIEKLKREKEDPVIDHLIERLNSQRFEDTLLGLYSPRYNLSGSPCIYLFRDRIERYANNTMVEPDPDAILSYAYIHELMHAYYDSVNNTGYTPVRELEEAFAEYGTLYFLFHAKGSVLSPVYSLAKCIVDAKGQIGPKGNGYGQDMASTLGFDNPEWIEKYRLFSNWIPHDYKEVVDFSSSVKTFDWSQRDNSFSLFMNVVNILFEDWKQPDGTC